jgi:hypothetical protein
MAFKCSLIYLYLILFFPKKYFSIIESLVSIILYEAMNKLFVETICNRAPSPPSLVKVQKKTILQSHNLESNPK